MNEVEFLGLAHACNLATFKTFCGQPAQKKDGYSILEMTNFTVVRAVLRNNY